MKISILGAGNVGGTLGRLWAAQGHQIMFGVRKIEHAKVQNLLESMDTPAQTGSVAEAAAFGEVVLLAVPWVSAFEVITQAGNLTDKVLIDVTNTIAPDPLDKFPSAAETIAGWATGAKVVKAFNTTGAANLADPKYGPYSIDTFICGDDVEAKEIATELAQAIGLEVVDVGPLANAALLESLGQLWAQLAYPLGMGPDIAFKLLKR